MFFFKMYIFFSFVVYILVDPSLFYILLVSAMLLSLCLGHFSSFDGITKLLNFSINKEKKGIHQNSASDDMLTF